MLRPTAAGEAQSGVSTSPTSSHPSPPGMEVVGGRHRLLVENVDVEVDPEAPGPSSSPFAPSAPASPSPCARRSSGESTSRAGQLTVEEPGDVRRPPQGRARRGRRPRQAWQRRPRPPHPGRGPRPNATESGMSAPSPVGDFCRRRRRRGRRRSRSPRIPWHPARRPSPPGQASSSRPGRGDAGRSRAWSESRNASSRSFSGRPASRRCRSRDPAPRRGCARRRRRDRRCRGARPARPRATRPARARSRPSGPTESIGTPRTVQSAMRRR